MKFKAIISAFIVSIGALYVPNVEAITCPKCSGIPPVTVGGGTR